VPTEPRTLSERELGRALLARQLLLERSTGSIAKTLERIGGIQAQYAPSMYVGLWTRLDGFERPALDRALVRRSVVQGTMMRSTIHLVSARDYWPLMLATRAARREQWLRTRKDHTAREVAAATRRVRSRIAGTEIDGDELTELAGGRVVAGGVGHWLELVRVPPSGTWERRRANLYASAEDWLGPPDSDPERGLELVVRRYLGGFGPASSADVASWAGVPPRTVAPLLERMKLRRFRDEQGDDLFDLPRAPLPGADVEAPVRFLPVWDATLLVHARRTGILPEEHRLKVFNARTPHSVNTFLVDGRVAGTWKHDGSRIAIEPFGRLPRSARSELRGEAEALAALYR
jgi:hypothetical protein